MKAYGAHTGCRYMALSSEPVASEYHTLFTEGGIRRPGIPHCL